VTKEREVEPAACEGGRQTCAASRDQDYQAWGWVVGFPRAGFPESSRLYVGVVLTRARDKTILLLFGNGLPALVAPLANLAPAHPSLHGGTW
jgi:hypothetical protein